MCVSLLAPVRHRHSASVLTPKPQVTQDMAPTPQKHCWGQRACDRTFSNHYSFCLELNICHFPSHSIRLRGSYYPTSLWGEAPLICSDGEEAGLYISSPKDYHSMATMLGGGSVEAAWDGLSPKGILIHDAWESSYFWACHFGAILWLVSIRLEALLSTHDTCCFFISLIIFAIVHSLLLKILNSIKAENKSVLVIAVVNHPPPHHPDISWFKSTQ